MIDVEQITDVVADLGEAPCWDDRSGRLLWVDMCAGSLLSTDVANGETERIDVGDRVAAFVRPTIDGNGLVVVRERDIQLMTADGLQPVASLPFAAGIRANDGGCDPQGRIYVGTLPYDESPGRGALWRVRKGGDPEILIGETTLSNGLGWSPDGTVAYFADSGPCRVDRFEFDGESGDFRSRATFVETDDKVDGIPDGLCVDVEGGVWVTLWGTGRVRRYDPDGSVSAQVEVDCPPLTACSFGGPNRDTLFITSSRYEDPYRDAPAGALFACSPGVAGLPLHPFDPATAS